MKLGVNPVNQDTKRVGVGLMDGGVSKIKRPTGHPSSETKSSESNKQGSEKQVSSQLPRSSGSHETLKAGVFILAAVSAFLIYKLKRLNQSMI